MVARAARPEHRGNRAHDIWAVARVTALSPPWGGSPPLPGDLLGKSAPNGPR